MYYKVFLVEIAKSEKGSTLYHYIIKASFKKGKGFTEESREHVKRLKKSKCSCCGKDGASMVGKCLPLEDRIIRAYSCYKENILHYICDDCISEGRFCVDEDENLITYDYFKKNKTIKSISNPIAF